MSKSDKDETSEIAEITESGIIHDLNEYTLGRFSVVLIPDAKSERLIPVKVPKRVLKTTPRTGVPQEEEEIDSMSSISATSTRKSVCFVYNLHGVEK